MQFSRYGALVGLLGCAVEASPALQAVRSEEKEIRSSGSCSSDLTKSWENEVFYSGIVQPATAELDAINLGLAFSEAALEGTVDLSCGDDFLLAPTVKVDLGGVKAYLKVALDATGGVSESINIFKDLSLSLAVPSLLEIDIDVGVALDLVFSTSAALDIETVFNVQFPTGCYIEINVLTQEIVKQDLTGLIVETLPQSISSLVSLEEDIELNVALRLRAGLGISSEIDIIGLDIGAGAEVALWANLFDYTTIFSQGSSGSGCSAEESFALTAGVMVEVDVEIDSLDLTLAPSVIVTLSSSPSQSVTVTIGEGSSQSWPWSFGTISGTSTSGSSSGSSGSGSGSESGSGSGSGSGALPSGSASNSGNEGSGSGSSSSGKGSSSGSSPASQGGEQTTITIQATQVHTVMSCAASITNCPAATATSEISAMQSSLGSSAVQPVVVTSVVGETTTICPVTAAEGVSSSVAASMSSAVVTTTISGSASYYIPSASPVPTSVSGSSGTGSGSGSGSGSDSSDSPSSAMSNGAIGASATTTLPAGMTTSTVVETHTYTMTSCAASVKNCPNTYTQQVVTSMVVSYTTICPVTATETQGASVATGSGSNVPSVATPTAASASASESSPAGGVPGVLSSSVPAASATSSDSAVGVTSPAGAASTTAASSVTIPTITSTVTMTPLATPTTSTQTIPSTVTVPSPTVVITQTPATTPAVATATAVASTGAGNGPKPSGASVYSDSPIYPTGSAPSYPSGAAAPSGFSMRPQRPSGVPVPVTTSVPAATTGSSASGQAKPSSSVVTAGASKAGFGMLAALAPIFVALM